MIMSSNTPGSFTLRELERKYLKKLQKNANVTIDRKRTKKEFGYR